MKNFAELRIAVEADRDGYWNALGVLACAERVVTGLMDENKNLGDEIDNLEEEACDSDDTIRKLQDRLTASEAAREKLEAALRDRIFDICEGSASDHDKIRFIRSAADKHAVLASLTPAQGEREGGAK